jgi:hypothetical protein
MRQPRLLASGSLALLLLAGNATAETRFGRPVVKLANPKEFESVQLEENRFAMLRKNAIEVACITYRESQRYYVEVAVTNHSAGPIDLAKDFVQFKANVNVIPIDTIAAASEAQKQAAPSVSTGLSTSRSSTISVGSTISPNEDRKGGTQMLQESMAQSVQAHANQLAARLIRYAHEKQALNIEPQGTRFYIFVFETPDRKKGPFEISVTAGDASWPFPYKE